MRSVGLSLVAGLLAAFIAVVVNRWAVLGGRRVAVAALVPLVEETAKTGAALALGAPIIAAHAVFGLTEAVYDAVKPSRHGLVAGLVGLIGHLGFGLAAGLVYAHYNSGPAAIASATFLHAVFNAAIIGRWPTEAQP